MPLREFVVCQAEPLAQVQSISQRHQVERVQRPQDDPDRHHVRVRVVVDTVVGTIGVSGVEFVGTDHPVDVVAILLRVVCRSAHPEPGDFGEHFGSVVDQIRQVAGHLVELPRVVRDGDADVMSKVAGIGVPPTRPRIQVQLWAFLASVAAGLPGVHRTAVAGQLGGPACFP